MRRRVVVTGIGVLSGLGLSAADHFAALVAGKCAIAPIAAFPVGDFPARYGVELKDFRAAKFLKNRKSVKVMARDIQISVSAASLAAREAGVYDRSPDPTRFGVSMGAGLIPTELDDLGAAIAASLDDNRKFDLRKYGKEGLAATQPLWLLKYLPNMVNSHVSIEYDAQGPDNCLTCGNASGLMAIGEAARIIERGDADLMFAGGAESKIHPLSLVRLHLHGKLSTASDLQERGPRPFAPDRSGLVVGEGAAVLMLEAEEHARTRGVRIYAEVAGFGASCGAQLAEEVAREGRAARECLVKALADANLDARDITAVFADASGLKEDEAEARAIADVLGTGKPVTTARAAAGHTMAASGALDAATACMSISNGVLPGVFGVDLDGPLVKVKSAQRAVQVDAAVVNSYTFGGQTASIVFKRYSQ